MVEAQVDDRPLADLPPVSVALPVYRNAATLEAAVASLLAQTHKPAEILIVLNGADSESRAVTAKLAREHRAVKAFSLPEANLAAALNHALDHAAHELVARMDADDTCHPQRLELQTRHMAAHKGHAAVGTAYDIIDDVGRVISTIRPPTDPAALRFRLLLGNILAHGSMMLRKTYVRAVGGYDATRSRAQDYHLWLRLSRAYPMAALPDVLYSYRAPDADRPSAPASLASAQHAAGDMLAAWRLLPDRPTSGEDERALRALVEGVIAGTSPDDLAGVVAAIHAQLGARPTREAMLAWLWSQWYRPSGPRHAYDAARRARLREVGLVLRGERVNRIYLWGAGEHTRFVLSHESDLGVPIAGLVDDHAHGQQRFGRDVLPPHTLLPGEVVVISSDTHEEAIWASSAAMRDRGVRVLRLYGSTP